MTNLVLRLVYDSSPSSKGKLLRSHKFRFGEGMLFVVIVDNNWIGAGTDVRIHSGGRKSGCGFLGYFLWNCHTKTGEFLSRSAGSHVVIS